MDVMQTRKAVSMKLDENTRRLVSDLRKLDREVIKKEKSMLFPDLTANDD